MSPRRKTTSHLPNLTAALLSWTAVTVTLLATAPRADGPDAHTYVPLLGAVLTVWTFASAWVLTAFGLATAAAVRELRNHRPRPGAGSRDTAPSLADVISWETVHRNRLTADVWVERGPAAPKHAGAAEAEQAADTGSEAWLDRVKGWAQQAAADAVDEADGRVAA